MLVSLRSAIAAHPASQPVRFRDRCGSARAHMHLTTFRRAQTVHSHCHIAPAGPACLNNNAPFRRGRPSLTARRLRVSLSAYDLSPEAIRSQCTSY